MTKAELLDLLRQVERAMSNQGYQNFNPWDLGPSDVLVAVRKALGLPTGEKKR